MAKKNKWSEPSKRGSANARIDDKKPSGSGTSATSGHRTPKELQQECLNIFHDALKPTCEDMSIVQEVKGHLFERDFTAAFGRDEYLRVYASRWSPSRALGYLTILDNLTEHIQPGSITSATDEEASPSTFRVACLGGGAGGELVALAGWLRAISAQALREDLRRVQIDLIDSANWSSITEELHKAIVTPPELSAYASQAKKEANRALLQPEGISINFHQIDLLSSKQISQFEGFAKADLVTCMFTLNELYGTSVSKTQQFLSDLTKSLRPDCYFLVVDSPGSYSTVSINGSQRKYPMQWLLDHTLRGPPDKADNEYTPWKRLKSDDSQWFRRPQGLQYPIELEDMRYQLHLYRKADIGGINNNLGG